ncbi:Kelch repeat-containing protein [Halococcus agarilyticus]|uniref:Kelch repeat-containing protein n=1 Tax=Halococcus agarilyticus TaxID=1232219 RepID=UPI0012AC55AC|nr:galactose oxidase [Halococcus agarilyticus]
MFLDGERVDMPSGGNWRDIAKLPAEQSDAGGGVLDEKLYYFGGFTSGPGLETVQRTFVLDPNDGDGTWRRAEDVPKALWAPCGVSTDTAIYSFGGAPAGSPYNGVSPSNEIFRYQSSDGWTNLTAETGVRCPYPNFAMGGVYNPADGLIYCLGGGTDVTDRESATTHGVRPRPGAFDESRVWTFDPETERVANPDLTRMPEAKRWHSVALIEASGGSCVHAIGGRLGAASPTDSNRRYNTAIGSWSSRQPAPVAGTYTTTSDPVIGNRVYLTHERTYTRPFSVDDYSTRCYRYDPAWDEYTELAQSKHRRGGAVDGVIDGQLYVAGGHLKRYDQDGYHDCIRNTTVFDPLES